MAALKRPNPGGATEATVTPMASYLMIHKAAPECMMRSYEDTVKDTLNDFSLPS